MALEIDLTGKAVLVTGGTKGVGRGIAQRFADAGASVVVCARREPENPLPDGWTFVPADLRDGEAAWAAVDAAHAVHGRLDCVVNNAGGSPPGRLGRGLAPVLRADRGPQPAGPAVSSPSAPTTT